jgi:preprotein translocase subunit SecG
MFLYNLVIFAFGLLCIFMIFLILMQKGKSSLGFGNLGGGTQLLFGGSGGQDLFQKVTWGMGALFIGGSLILAMLKKPSSSRVLSTIAQQQIPTAAPVIPAPSLPESPAPSAEQQTEA